MRSPKQVQTSSIGALIQSTGLARAVDDTAVVEDFIMSRDAVRRLEQENDLRAVFGRSEGDFVTRFPGILRRSDFEALFRRYDLFVSVETDHTSGVHRVARQGLPAGRRADDRESAAELREQLINELNERARKDTLGTARHEVDRAQERISGSRDSSRPTECNKRCSIRNRHRPASWSLSGK